MHSIGLLKEFNQIDARKQEGPSASTQRARSCWSIGKAERHRRRNHANVPATGMTRVLRCWGAEVALEAWRGESRELQEVARAWDVPHTDRLVRRLAQLEGQEYMLIASSTCGRSFIIRIRLEADFRRQFRRGDKQQQRPVLVPLTELNYCRTHALSYRRPWITAAGRTGTLAPHSHTLSEELTRAPFSMSTWTTSKWPRPAAHIRPLVWC